MSGTARSDRSLRRVELGRFLRSLLAAVAAQALWLPGGALAAADSFSGAVLVARAGSPIVRGSWGLANREAREPNRPDTKFNLGSIDKLITRIAVWQLVAAGKLDLDAPVADNLNAIASSLNRDIEDLVVIVLDRPNGCLDQARWLGERLGMAARFGPVVPLAEVPPLVFIAREGFMPIGLKRMRRSRRNPFCELASIAELPLVCVDVQRGGQDDPRRASILQDLTAAIQSQRFDAIILDDNPKELAAFWNELLAPYYRLPIGRGLGHNDHWKTGIVVSQAYNLAHLRKAPVPGDPYQARAIYYYYIPPGTRPTFIVDVSGCRSNDKGPVLQVHPCERCERRHDGLDVFACVRERWGHAASSQSESEDVFRTRS